MLIVAGHYIVDPADREAFLASRVETMRATRSEPGCLEYISSADPVDDSRVVLFERWADQETFDAHVKLLMSAPRPESPAHQSMEIKIFEVAGERSLG